MKRTHFSVFWRFERLQRQTDFFTEGVRQAIHPGEVDVRVVQPFKQVVTGLCTVQG